MFDHLGFTVADLVRARAFYETALAPLGVAPVLDIPAGPDGDGATVGFGFDGKPFLWMGEGKSPNAAIHVAFAAPTRIAVDAFYIAALKAGGQDNGPPGLRPHYHANYYAAFVIDPEGRNIEAVCHRAE